MVAKRIGLTALLTVFIAGSALLLWNSLNKQRVYAFRSCVRSFSKALLSGSPSDLGLSLDESIDWTILSPERVDRLLANHMSQLDCGNYVNNGQLRDPWGNPISVCVRRNEQNVVDVVVATGGPDHDLGTADDICVGSGREIEWPLSHQ